MTREYFTDRVARSEFEQPDKMDPKLVRSLVELRARLNTPIRFTKYNGLVWHPDGDACPPSSTSHAAKSLHKWGLPGQPLGLAQDFDVFNDDLIAGWAIFEAIIGTGLFRGMGYYLDWNTLGYHVDCRPYSHFTLPGAEYHKVWIRDVEGEYHYLPKLADRRAFMDKYVER